MDTPGADELTGDFVRRVEFSSRLRGYDPSDVDPILDDLAATLDRVRAELEAIESGAAPRLRAPKRPRPLLPRVASVAALLHVRDAARRARAIVDEARAAAEVTDDELHRGRARVMAGALLRLPRPEPVAPAATVPDMPAANEDRRCLLTVHAHPDDEASKGAGTIAKYNAQGVRTVLVCCTGGEAGDILNPVMDTPDVRANLADVRRKELDAAAEVIGYDKVVMLGYRDSGMPDTPENADERCFARAELGEAVGRLVTILRRERPQVVITYGDRQERYPHPDHLRVHEVTLAAVDAAADPDRYREAGEAFAVAKVYYTAWSRARLRATHEKFIELGLESPYQPTWFEGPDPDTDLTTHIELRGGFEDIRREALLAHATQIDPTSPFWFGLPPEVAREIHPYDDYVLARGTPGPLPEDDLFAGLPVLAEA